MGASSACIVIDGVVVAAVEEERLTRLKNDGGFPFEAIRMCLDSAEMSMEDLDQIAVYWKPWKIVDRGLAVFKSLIVNPRSVLFMLKRLLQSLFGLYQDRDRYPELRGSWLDLFRIKSKLRDEFGDFSATIRFYDHHDTHAASIFYLSNFDNAICLTYDGGGETSSTIVHAFTKGIPERLLEIGWPNSLGHYYSAFTGFLGFRMLEGEYKMMGLAPYGKPVYKDKILENILLKSSGGKYKLNTSVLNYHSALGGVFSNKLEELFGPARHKDEEFNQRHRDLACSVQAAYEEVLLHILTWAKSRKPEYENLCIAGGCALNVTANGKVVTEGLFTNIVIPPAPHDAGCAIGAAWLSELEIGTPADKLIMQSPYLGRDYSKIDIERAFVEMGLSVPEMFNEDELIERSVAALASSEILAWFQGGSEFGPRALGNRSFLADPRNDSIREVLNSKIKKRELFRPFAPSCKSESAREFFIMDHESPYMNIVATVREDKRNIIPAVTHIDGTARVHTVTQSSNPLYWRLLDAFENKTGVGVLLNTSLNIQEPIVESPTQAISCFLRSSVDWLVIGPYMCGDDWRKRILKLDREERNVL